MELKARTPMQVCCIVQSKVIYRIITIDIPVGLVVGNAVGDVVGLAVGEAKRDMRFGIGYRIYDICNDVRWHEMA